VPSHIDRDNDLHLIDQVDTLNEEVKVLALNLAIYLAKAKGESEQIRLLEPDFIRLVNGTVKIVQELALIIDAARNQKQRGVVISSDNSQVDQIETKLRSILNQCTKIMNSLMKTSQLKQ
jgi:hypothetical protein